ncbi:uncharacterized protein LOC113324308 [Papaver somniferum]|uniref:uncharacterized protein LOC113324308 n=1 Tax=Papaver somniferum TaxID=3469 RepID=UPI000E6F8890|nr:uncharacterized protein LOC113324308 [Papaver somniferum]
MSRYLGNYQFEVGIPCGGEAILHAANNLLEMHGHYNSKTMLLVDFTNAFNLVDRYTMIREVRTMCPSISNWVEFCYSKPARLYYNDVVLSSAKGVQQGDRLGPLLFALILHPLVNKITAECTLDLHAWYLDDGTLIGDTMEVSKALKIIQDEGPAKGLHLNINKTEIYCPSVDPRRESIGVFPAAISKPTRGVKVLGGPMSLDQQFCSNMVLDRVAKTTQLMHKIRKLQDPQRELLLLRNCTGVFRLYFTMRTTSPMALQEATAEYDNQLQQYLRQLIVGDGAGYGVVQQRFTTMPIKDCGLGIYTMADTSRYCFLASCSQIQHLQTTILQDTTTFESGQRYQHAMQLYTRSCGLSPIDFNINDVAPSS